MGMTQYFAIASLTFCLGVSFQTPVNASVTATLEHTQLPATGHQQSIVTIGQFGRYALRVNSEQGSSLQIIDKMAGPSEINGIAGQKNGRLDMFLDQGSYKLLINSHEAGLGDAKLEILPFTEMNLGLPPVLIDYKLIHAQLADFEKRSYWIELKTRTNLVIEASGRSLGDLRIWKDGNWLLNHTIKSDIIEPQFGKPLHWKGITLDLNPGMYLVVAYGGEAQAWSETSTDHAFYLRMGIPVLAQTGREHLTMSPFGIDRWLVPAQSDYYRLELNIPAEASLSVSDYYPTNVFHADGKQTPISKTSRVPVAELRTYSNSTGFEIITIKAPAKTPYIFQHFHTQRSRQLSPGHYWVSTLHSGSGSDSIDATAMLTDNYQGKETYLDNRAIKISNDQTWQRRFNLLDEFTVFVEITDTGNYQVSGDERAAQYRFEPFLTRYHRDYQAPHFKNLGENWNLDAGFYKLSVKPRNQDKGIITLSINAINTPPIQINTAQTSIRFPQLDVKSRHYYTIYLNQQPAVTTGILARELPIDIKTPLPIHLMAGEDVSVPIQIDTDGELRVLTEDGKLLEFLVGNTRSKHHQLTQGHYSARFTNLNDQDHHYQLIFIESSLLDKNKLTPISLNQLNTIPQFPTLNTTAMIYRDVERKELISFNIDVEKAGLYSLASTGLLQTEGTLRTRVVTQLDQQSSNGIGRNFLINQYLREGNYQLSIAPQGQTQGHLGVELKQTRLNATGNLSEGFPARYSLAAGEGLRYTFEITERASYQLRSYGIHGELAIRLEDSDGWPLITPGSLGNLSRIFEPGSYQLVILPRALDTRVITLLTKDTETEKLIGHGPFNLLPNQSIEHTWLETSESNTSENRVPDQWLFNMPANSDTSIVLSRGMIGKLFLLHADSKNSKTLISTISNKKNFLMKLSRGSYLLETLSQRKNNYFDYQLSIQTQQFIVNQTKDIQLPATIPVAIGISGIVEISSSGMQDVKASLYRDGKLIASNDDRDNDWNFSIVTHLDVGDYTLKIMPVNASSGSTEISLNRPENKQESPRSLPAEFTIDDGLIHSYPLRFKPAEGIFIISAQSRESVAITIDKQLPNGNWKSISSRIGINPLLAISVNTDTSTDHHYRMTLGSSDKRTTPIGVQAGLLKTQKETEKSLKRGFTPKYQTWQAHQLAAVEIKLDRPGVLLPNIKSSKLRWASETDSGFDSKEGEVSSGNSSKLWLLSFGDNDRKNKKISASRIGLIRKNISLDLHPTQPSWFDLSSKPRSMELLVSSSRQGQSGVKIEQGQHLLGMGFDIHSAVDVTNNETKRTLTRRVKVWNATSSNEELTVNLNRYTYSNILQKTLTQGTYDDQLNGLQAIRYYLPSGLNKLEFSLAKFSAASLLKENGVEKTYWSGQQKENYTLTSDANSIVIFNTINDPTPLSINVQPMKNGAIQLPLMGNNIIKHYFSKAARSFIDIELSDIEKQTGIHVKFYGNTTNILSLDAKGQFHSGKNIVLHTDARIMLQHRTGYFSMWLAGNSSSSNSSELAPFNLDDELVLTGQQQRIAIKPQEAMLLGLTSTNPLILRYTLNHLPEKILIYENAINANIFIPKGSSVFTIESINNTSMHDTLLFQANDAIEITEGLGDTFSLSAGDARLFTFNINGSNIKHPIGIGVKSSIDIARCRLFNEQGQLIGKGISQYHELVGGNYYLLIDITNNGEAVNLQPALIGLDEPSTAASHEVMLRYQQLIAPDA